MPRPLVRALDAFVARRNGAKERIFYHHAFGWSIRRDSDGAVAFDDTVGGVSGMWVRDRPPATEPGLMVSVMVADAAAVVAAILTAGGEIARPVDAEAQEKFAWFRDPAGNVLGIYQQPGLADTEHARAVGNE